MKNTKNIILSLIVLSWAVAAMAQVPTTNHTAFSGTCNEDSVILTADSVGDFYVWTKNGVAIPQSTQSIKVPLNEAASYSCSVRDVAPVVSANMMENGSFEEPYNTAIWYNKSGTYQPFNSDYKYYSSDGWDPVPGFYDRHERASGLYVITKNAHKMWRNLLDITADDGQYYAYFDAAAAGDAWKASSSAQNPNLKTIKDSVYVFSFSAVNINKHMSGAGVVDVTPPTAADLEYLKVTGKYVVAVRLPNTCNDVIWTNNPTNTSAWYYFQELPGFNGWYYTLLPTSVTTGNIYQLKDDGTYKSEYNIPLTNYTIVSGNVTGVTRYNTVYFDNNDGWSAPNINVYIWDGGEQITGSWPGAAAENIGGNKWKFEVPAGKIPNSNWKIIWSNSANEGNKTGDLNYVDGATYNKGGVESSPTQPTYLTVTNTSQPMVMSANYWNQWPCRGDFNSIDSHPAKLQFTISNGSETINLGEPIDLDCRDGEPMHTWQRRELTWKAKWTSNNITIAVKNLTNVAGNGNDFGLDRIMFQMKDVNHSKEKGISNFSVSAATNPSVTFEDQTISSTATTVTARVTAVSNADYPVVATITLNGNNYSMTINSVTASQTLTLSSTLSSEQTATVSFTDAKGCTGTSSFKVTVTGKPSVSINPIEDLCSGDAKSITVSFAPSANAAQYKYCVKEGSTVKKAYTAYAPIPAAKSFTIDITNWDAGKTYTVYMKVKGAEESDEVSEEFTINALPSATLTAAAICEKDKKFVLKATSITESPTYSFVLDGKTYTGTLSATNTINLQSTLTAKTYSDVSVTLTSAFGCEKVVKFSLKVNPVYATGAENASVCKDEAYTWTGHVGTGHKLYIDGESVTTIPTDVVKTITVVDSMKTVGCGCDSVATLKLTVNPTYNVDTTAVVCDSFTWHGVTYTSTPTDAPTHNYGTKAGCDSIVTLKLTINKSYQVDTTAVECDSFTWHGVTYTSTPTEAPTYNYGTKAGCDSVVTLKLTINKSYQVDTTAVECDSFTWHGVTYTSTPTEAPTYNYGTVAGCDSIVTLKLTINKSYQVDTTAVECDSFTWHGVTYMSTPTEAPTHNYGTKAGCDSIVTLYLTVNKSKTSEEIVRNCGAYTWEGVEYTISGDYTETLVAANGCDSVATLHLTVLNDNLMYTKWGNLVLCADRNRDLKSYQWYINGAEVPGATGQYFTGDNRILTEKLSVRAITQTGDTLYSCEKTFAEMTTSPDQSKEEYIQQQNGPVRVYSISGRLMCTAEGNVEDVVSHLPAGIYILRWEDKAVRWVVY